MHEKRLSDRLEQKLTAFSRALVDQDRARILIPAAAQARGYWFGSGNMVEGEGGLLYLCGRYRNSGDSRTGLDLGDRGKELAVFESRDRGASWTKILSFDKAALSPAGIQVLSIEGSALRPGPEGVELYVSSEKRIPYPEAVSDFLKPGTGVWTIERLRAPTIAELRQAIPETLLRSDVPSRLHLKDPFIFRSGGDHRDGRLNSGLGDCLGFCHHPFGWSSSNSGYLRLDAEKTPATAPTTGASPLHAAVPITDFFPRGTTWDVAITRTTCILSVPRRGAFADLDTDVHLVFYDGGESLRNLDEHEKAVRRPRGYSCEELGGLGYYLGPEPASIVRLSENFPFFVSPGGSGASRYVSVLATNEGYFATWQRSQPDWSQPLVMNFVSTGKATSLLA